MKKESEELVSVEDTARNMSKNKKNVEKNKEAVNPAEMVLGCMMVSVVIILTLFSSSLIQVFKVVPTNLVLAKSTIQLLLFTMSNKANSISLFPDSKTEVVATAVQGLLSGMALLCSVAAVRLLPLGDFFSIIFAKSVLMMILMTTITGQPINKMKSLLIMSCMVGLIVLVKTQTSSTSELPALDPHSDIWQGLGLAFLHLVCSSLGEGIIVQTPQVAPGVVSLWSAVGGLVICIPAFFSSQPSILSGSLPSYMQAFLLVFLSLATIAAAIFADQAHKLTSQTFVKAIRSSEIPLGLLVSLSLACDEYHPSYLGCCGIVMVVISSVAAQHQVEGDNSKSQDQSQYQIV